MNKYLLAAALFASVCGAHAQGKTEGIYIGAGVGMGSTKFSNYNCIASSCKDSDGVSRFYLGYQFSPTWAAEFGQTTLAKNVASNNGVGVTVDPGTATEFSLLARRSFNPAGWGMFARFGVSSLTSTASGVVKSSKPNTSPVIGFGVDYAYSNGFGVRFEADARLFNAGPPPNGAGSADLSGASSTFSISGNYRF